MRLPRPYQTDCINAVQNEFMKGVVSTLVEMGTGLGKTVVAGWLTRLEQGRCLFMAHRTELIKQAKDKLGDINPDDIIETEQGLARATGGVYSPGSGGGRIVVASKDTLCKDKRLNRFPPNAFDLLIVDEGHRCVRKNASYWKPLKRFVAPPIGTGTAKLVLITATAKRHDKEALGFNGENGIIQSVAYSRKIGEGIEDGYLCSIFPKRIRIDSLEIDWSRIKTQRNEFGEIDFNVGEMERMTRTEKYIRQLIEPLYETACEVDSERKNAVVFMPGVWAAQKAADVLNTHYRKGCAVAITQDLSPGQRDRALKMFQNREIQFLTNCDILTEGWDSDAVDIVVPRFTMSVSKLAQMIGRGTRPIDGCVDIWPTAAERRRAIANSPKPYLLVMDPTGVSAGFMDRMAHVADIFEGTFTPEQIKEAKNNPKVELKPIDELLKEAKERQRLEAEERLRVVKFDVNYELSPVELCQHFNVKPITYIPPQFIGKPVTEGMIRFIEGRGVRVKPGITFFEAKKIIEAIRKEDEKRPATPSQRKTLMRNGVCPDVSYATARKYIDKLRKNNWVRPDDVPEDPKFKGMRN